MEPGKLVRVISAPDRTGTLRRFEFRGETKRWLVHFGNNSRWFPESNLEILEEDESLLELLRGKRFGKPIHLRKAITSARLTGRLAEVIYSMEATNTNFYAYQFKPVLNMLESTSDGILIADEVGLGKTIEAGLIWTELVARQNARNLLVVCPASLCKKWQDELRDRFGVRAEICNAKDLLNKIEQADRYGDEINAIISIQGMRPSRNASANPRTKLRDLIEERAPRRDLFDCVIIDEAHHMRNPDTQTHLLGKLLRPATKHLILLSATPIQLRNDDLFHLLQIIDEENFSEKDDFDQMVRSNRPILAIKKLLVDGAFTPQEFQESLEDCLKIRNFSENRQLKALKESPPNSEFLKDINKRVRLANRIERINSLSSIISRTRKRDVKERRVIRQPESIDVLMTDNESAIYSKVTEQIYDYCENNYSARQANFFVIIPQRQLCSSIPAAVRRWQEMAKSKSEEATDSDVLESVNGTTVEKIESTKGSLTGELAQLSSYLGSFQTLKKNDSKYAMLSQTLAGYWDNYPGKKVVIFAYYRFTLEYLKERFDEDGIASVLMMGGMTHEEKKKGIKQFKEKNDIQILLTSETLSEGVDLQFCSVLINYDLPWNPMKVEQRIGRIDRIGQKEELIRILNLFYKDTLDDRIYERLYNRLDIFRQALGDLESVLGDKISELSFKLISHRLTTEQQNEQIEQTAIALANQRDQQEELESKAGDLNAHGDYILNKVKAAESLKRFIQGQDLWLYIKDFIKDNYPGSTLLQEEPNSFLVKISLSQSCKNDLAFFLEEQPRLRNKTRLHTAKSDQSVDCYFDNNMDMGTTSHEVINQQHPLVQFVSSKYNSDDRTQYQLIATQLEQKDFPSASSGLYLVLVQRWSTKSASEHESLIYRGIDTHTMEIQPDEFSERLLLAAVNQGANWTDADVETEPEILEDAYIKLDQIAIADFEEHCSYMQLENEDRVDSLISTIKSQHEKFSHGQRETINKVKARSGDERIIRMREGYIKNNYERAKARIAEYESRRGNVSSETADIALVAIRIND